MKRIHIVGSGPRTGTTLFTEVMSTCFKIDHVCEHEASICTALPKRGNCLLTKQPGEISAIRLPLLLNPDLYVICIIRDPRDSVASFHGTCPDVYWTGLRYWKLFVKKYDKLIKNDRFIPIKYENFVSNPNRIQDHLMKKLPFLEKTYNFSEYHIKAKPNESALKALKNLRPIETNGIGSWKKHLPRVKQQIALHGSISEELIKFGYERDRTWEHLLYGIETGRYETCRPEYLTLMDNFHHQKHQYLEVANIFARKIGLEPIQVLKPVKTNSKKVKFILQFTIKSILNFFRKLISG